MELKGINNITKGEILNYVSPEEIFAYYLGEQVDLQRRYLSPFRQDNKPGCRFVIENGYLNFLDNAGGNHLTHNCFDIAEFITKDPNIAQRIWRDLNLKNKKRKTPVKYTKKERKIDIRFIANNYDNCYLTKEFNLPGYYLKSLNIYSPEAYWCNTSSELNLVKNRFGIKNCIAYYFPDSDNTKLYFPEQQFKFFTNTNNDDIYLYDVVDYSQDYLVITKSGKDTAVLNYHLGLNVVGVQQEYFVLTEKWKELILNFKTVYILFDNDNTGKQQSKKTQELLTNITNPQSIFFSVDNDSAEAYKNNRLDEILKYF